MNTFDMDMDGSMEPTPNGRWVRYEDYAKAIEWKNAVIDHLVCAHVYNSAHEDDPRMALHDAMSWEVQVALDPLVSLRAQELIDREREECAMISDMWSKREDDVGAFISRAIRARRSDRGVEEWE